VNPSSPQNHFELPDIEAAAAKIGRAALQAPRLGAPSWRGSTTASAAHARGSGETTGSRTRDQALWVSIRNRTKAISFSG
jgi:hypothetical protein